ncbi:hypothetical protein HOL24_04430 [bacterium]|jgi:hypothetical protein|nr:hypothetical protein [bacterium]
MNFFFNFLINFIVDKTILWPFYYPIVHFMKEVKVDGLYKSNGITILAINPIRFRGDLEVLAKAGFKVYTMPYKWQTRIFYAYRDLELVRSKPEFQIPATDSSIYTDRIRIRHYLAPLLRKIFHKRSIDCVIGAGLFYNQDLDWGASTVDIGFPYIVFHRENLVVSEQRIELYKEKAKHLKKIGFKGSAIVFHNTTIKSIFDKYSGVDNSKIYALGALRMDGYLKKIKSVNRNIRNKRITLFSFTKYNGLRSTDNTNLSKLYDNVHKQFIELANDNTDIEFVIKHKGICYQDLLDILEKNKAYDIENLKIYGDDKSAQDLILTSDVISSFCTTALLEAAVAAKPIVFPLFYEAKELESKNSLCFDNIYELCTVSQSHKDYKKIIMDEYHNIEFTKINLKYRESQFEKYVSSLNGNSKQRYTDLVKSVVKYNNI